MAARRRKPIRIQPVARGHASQTRCGPCRARDKALSPNRLCHANTARCAVRPAATRTRPGTANPTSTTLQAARPGFQQPRSPLLCRPPATARPGASSSRRPELSAGRRPAPDLPLRQRGPLCCPRIQRLFVAKGGPLPAQKPTALPWTALPWTALPRTAPLRARVRRTKPVARLRSDKRASPCATSRLLALPVTRVATMLLVVLELDSVRNLWLALILFLLPLLLLLVLVLVLLVLLVLVCQMFRLWSRLRGRFHSERHRRRHGQQSRRHQMRSGRLLH